MPFECVATKWAANLAEIPPGSSLRAERAPLIVRKQTLLSTVLTELRLHERRQPRSPYGLRPASRWHAARV
jgi:hypothetical protein